ncbi:MAG: DUF3037 domain-containing protein [Muribaculaceae bacterium]|nr:DUF3037 domain-containing protein [Muribaculaceae bacterium]
MNADALIYEYATVRYVPDIEREEFVNVGLLMMCKRRRWFRSEFLLDESRLRAFDPAVDLPALENQLKMFAADSSALADLPVEERFRWFSAVKSCVIQTSRPHPGLIPPESSPEETFNRLFTALVKR